MSSWVGILPYVYEPYLEACTASMAPSFRERCILRDNTVENLGVAGSWNMGVDEMRRQGADWLVIVSAAMRFGEPGGVDFLAALERPPASVWAVEAGACPSDPSYGFGWHLIAFPATTFDLVGTFDENFWPAYYEDLDFGMRIRHASGWQLSTVPIWPKVEVDATLASFAHGVTLGEVEVLPHRLARYYERKWGVLPGTSDLGWTHPFSLHEHPLSWWPKPGERLALPRQGTNRQPAT